MKHTDSVTDHDHDQTLSATPTPVYSSVRISYTCGNYVSAENNMASMLAMDALHEHNFIILQK